MGVVGLSSLLPPVRAAACRFLGVVLTYQQVIHSYPDVFKTATQLLTNKLRNKTESILSVRIRACWALANISDPYLSLTKSKEQGGGNTQHSRHRHSRHRHLHPLMGLLPFSSIIQLSKALLQASDDNAKLHPNSIRALGNLARIIIHTKQQKSNTKHQRDEQRQTDVKKTAVESSSTSPQIRSTTQQNSSQLLQVWFQVCKCLESRLVAGASGKAPAKATWNASYAIGNLFQNPTLPESLTSDPRATRAIKSIVDRLVLLVIGEGLEATANFKIRIHAAGALAKVPTLDHFGTIDAFAHSLESLMKAVKDFKPNIKGCSFLEIQYQGQLRAKLYIGLCHLLTLCSTAKQPGHKTTIFQIVAPRATDLAESISSEIVELDKAQGPEDWDPNSGQMLAEFRLSAKNELPLFRRALECVRSYAKKSQGGAV